MFRTGQDVQITLNDRMLIANDQTKKAVATSRAKLVGDIIYPNVEEAKFADLYSEIGSRPNIEIRRYVSALVLKRMYHLSDEVLLEFLRCGALNFQYALHTTQEEKQPLSESSIRRFRRKVEAYNEENGCDLIKDEFERISKVMAVEMGLLHADPNSSDDESAPILVRMDSMEIEAHAKAMTRIEILYMTNMIMIRYLLKKNFSNIIPEELFHYLEEGDHNRVMYYRVAEEKKAGVQDCRVAEAVQEMVLLREALSEYFSQKFLSDIPEYQVLQRVLEEQTQLSDDGVLIPRNKKNISAGSVQNPFDATVTYRYKWGQHHGHVLNVAEVCGNNGNGIIIHASIEPNIQSDNRMAEEYLRGLPDGGRKQKLTADGAYASETVEKLAAEKNVELQVTSLTGKLVEDVVADFVLNEGKTEILSCPAGNTPTGCRYNPNNGSITATMPGNCCASCPHRDECKAKVNNKKSKSTVRITGKMVTRAKQARNFTTEEGKKNADFRNGVEGIMSVMRRKYDLDHIPVFGLDRLKNWIWPTLLSYNLVKYNRYRIALEKKTSAA